MSAKLSYGSLRFYIDRDDPEGRRYVALCSVEHDNAGKKVVGPTHYSSSHITALEAIAEVLQLAGVTES